MLNRLISIAPMMDWTDRHDRFFLRIIAPNVLLYTEMVTTGALLQGKNPERFLEFDPFEQPLALQLGGSNPKDLAECARRGEWVGYDEINLNVGCPSDRVKAGKFGACLMLEKDLVAECLSKMISAVKIPVTVKCRIGVDDQDSYEHLNDFIQTIAQAGCQVFIIHARKAWLKGLSPKQNREIPPLQYSVVHRIKQDFPNLTIILNGGISSLDIIEANLPYVDGVMIGREAYHNPYFLTAVEQRFYPSTSIIDRKAVIEKFIPYIENQLKDGVKLSNITRHILGLFHGEVGARQFRRYLSENAPLTNSGINIIKEALHYV
jgi:tRNA-dihydrouridine synthase A